MRTTTSIAERIADDLRKRKGAKLVEALEDPQVPAVASPIDRPNPPTKKRPPPIAGSRKSRGRTADAPPRATICQGVDLHNGLPRPCTAPVSGTAFCPRHAADAERQDLWRRILRPSWIAALEQAGEIAPIPLAPPDPLASYAAPAPQPAPIRRPSPVATAPIAPSLAAWRSGS